MIDVLISEYENMFKKKKLIFLRSLLCYYRTPKYRVVVLIRCALRSEHKFMRKWYRNKLAIKYGVELGTNPKIGKNLKLEHFQGIVIGDDVIIGDDCILYQQVTLGQKNGKYPIIGDRVVVFAGAKVIGNVNIGNDSIIGANAVVLKDVQSNKCAVGIPAKVIHKRLKNNE